MFTVSPGFPGGDANITGHPVHHQIVSALV